VGGWVRGRRESSITVMDGEIYEDGGEKEREYQGRRGVYREVLIFLATTLSLLTSTAKKATVVAGKGTSRSGNCSFI
jgi:hypothetical protein